MKIGPYPFSARRLATLSKAGSVTFNLGSAAIAVTGVRRLSLVTRAIVVIWLTMIYAASQGFRRVTEQPAAAGEGEEEREAA